jgi:hypothetical protein
MFRAAVKSTLSTCIVGMVILFCSASLLWGVANGSVTPTVRQTESRAAFRLDAVCRQP